MSSTGRFLAASRCAVAATLAVLLLAAVAAAYAVVEIVSGSSVNPSGHISTIA
jgi:hypothetical protein